MRSSASTVPGESETPPLNLARLCHPERSEGSAVRRKMQIPRFARDDNSQILLTLRAQQLAQLVIDLYRVLRGLIDQFNPAAQVFGRGGLRNQVGGLHDGFKRIAEIVRESAEFFRQFRRNFLGGISHGLGRSVALANPVTLQIISAAKVTTLRSFDSQTPSIRY